MYMKMYCKRKWQLPQMYLKSETSEYETEVSNLISKEVRSR